MKALIINQIGEAWLVLFKFTQAELDEYRKQGNSIIVRGEDL